MCCPKIKQFVNFVISFIGQKLPGTERYFTQEFQKNGKEGGGGECEKKSLGVSFFHVLNIVFLGFVHH